MIFLDEKGNDIFKEDMLVKKGHGSSIWLFAIRWIKGGKKDERRK